MSFHHQAAIFLAKQSGVSAADIQEVCNETSVLDITVGLTCQDPRGQHVSLGRRRLEITQVTRWYDLLMRMVANELAQFDACNRLHMYFDRLASL